MPNLGVLVEGHTRCTEQFGAIETFTGGLLLSLGHEFADVTERTWGGFLPPHDLGQTGDQEVVWQFFDASDWQLGPLSTQRTREFPVIAVLFVGWLRVDVVFDASLAESVKAVETLGVLVAVEADLADEELVVDLLSQFVRRGGGHRDAAARNWSRGGGFFSHLSGGVGLRRSAAVVVAVLLVVDVVGRCCCWLLLARGRCDGNLRWVLSLVWSFQVVLFV